MTSDSADSARFVGDIPRYYDRCLGPVLFRPYAEDMARRVVLRAPRTVLELAAGTGIVTRLLRDRLHRSAELTATDLNADMLEIAREKFEPDERVRFETADATALPFKDRSFDCVVCQFGLMFFPDRPAALREARRVLKPHGRLLFNVWDGPRYNSFARIGREVVDQFFPYDPPKFLQTPFSWPDIDPVKTALIEAGFGQLAIYVLPRVHDLGDTQDFARGLVFGSPLIVQIRERERVAADSVVEALAQALAAEFGSPARLPMQAILFDAARG
jgi:ubiquinone/menaquinone biosynthesis C-methylase UbiE